MSTALRFWKMHGAGNDFVVIGSPEHLHESLDRLAERMCERRLGVGADGLIAVTRAASGEVEIEFYNGDGSPAEFCGNGARCAAWFARQNELAGDAMTLRFPTRSVRASIRDGRVEIEVPRPKEIGLVTVPGLEGVAGWSGLRVDAGVEHVVVAAPAGGALPTLAEMESSLAAGAPELAAGTNLTRVVVSSRSELRIATLERGAGETLACGSGALAAAQAVARDVEQAEFVVLPPSLCPLTVRLDGSARLSGDVTVVYRGELS